VTLEEVTEGLRKREEATAAHLRAAHETQLAAQIAAGAPPLMLESLRNLIATVDDGIDARTANLATAVIGGWSGDEFVSCNFLAEIPYPARISVTPDQIVLPGNNTIGSMVAIDCGGAISIG
jgi:hypothetical protein